MAYTQYMEEIFSNIPWMVPDSSKNYDTTGHNRPRLSKKRGIYGNTASWQH